MKTHILTLGLVAALAGCSGEDHTIVAGPADDTDIAAAGQVVLPPSIQVSKTYRCADNVIVHVDWLSDGKSATVRSAKVGTPTLVSAPEAGKPMTAASGHSLAGTAEAGSVKIAMPGKNAQSCKA